MWSFFSGGSSSRRKETPHEITLRAVRERYDSLNAKQKDAQDQAEAYMRRARQVMGFAGQPNRGKRKMAAQLVRSSNRLEKYAEQISSVQMLLAEQLLALEEQEITRSVVGVIRQATSVVSKSQVDPSAVQDCLLEAQESIEDHRDAFDQITTEAARTYDTETLDIDDGLDALLFETGQPEATGAVVPPPTYTDNPKPVFVTDAQRALENHLADLEAALKIQRAPAPPTIEPKPKQPGSGATPLTIGI